MTSSNPAADAVILLGSTALAVLVCARASNQSQRTLYVITYLVWHTPLLASMLLPFSTPLSKDVNRWIVVLLLASIHLVLIMGMHGRRHGANLRQDRLPLPPLFAALALVGVLLLAYEFFLVRGITFGGSLYENRIRYITGDVTPLGQLGGLLAGFSIFLLFWVVERGDSGVSVRPTYLIPYLLTGTTYAFSGNRQFIFVGLLVLMLKLVLVSRIRWRPMLLRGTALLLVFVFANVSFSVARQPVEGADQHAFLVHIFNVQEHPDAVLWPEDPKIRQGMLLVYIYGGMQFEVASKSLELHNERYPPLSLTFPLLYRRIDELTGSPPFEDVRSDYFSEFERETGMFPYIWATSFTHIHGEWGPFGLGAAVVGLGAIHRRVARNQLQRPNGFTFFYVLLIWGIIAFPFVEVTLVGTVLAFCTKWMLERLTDFRASHLGSIPRDLGGP